MRNYRFTMLTAITLSLTVGAAVAQPLASVLPTGAKAVMQSSIKAQQDSASAFMMQMVDSYFESAKSLNQTDFVVDSRNCLYGVLHGDGPLRLIAITNQDGTQICR